MDGKIWKDLRGLVMKVWDWFDRCYRFIFIFLIDIKHIETKSTN